MAATESVKFHLGLTDNGHTAESEFSAFSLKM